MKGTWKIQLQGTLTEGEGSVPLTSSLRYLFFCNMVNIKFNIKTVDIN
jgi:hypothetical protein